EGVAQRVDVVPVDRAVIEEAELLEDDAQRVLRDDALQRVIPALQHVLDLVADPRDAADGALDGAQPRVQPGRAARACRIGARRAATGADAHVVVVEHDDELEVLVRAAVIERFEGVASCSEPSPMTATALRPASSLRARQASAKPMAVEMLVPPW